MSDAQKWSQKRNWLLRQALGTQGQICGWKSSFANEIGARYIEAALRHVGLLIDELKRYDSYSKVMEMRQKENR